MAQPPLWYDSGGLATALRDVIPGIARRAIAHHLGIVHPDLEAIVSADEEARSRVALAEARRSRDVAGMRAACDASIDARRQEAADALAHELRAIAAEADARVAELQRQQEQYLAALAEAGDRRFEDAVALYLRIVCEAGP